VSPENKCQENRTSIVISYKVFSWQLDTRESVRKTEPAPSSLTKYFGGQAQGEEKKVNKIGREDMLRWLERGDLEPGVWIAWLEMQRDNLEREDPLIEEIVQGLNAWLVRDISGAWQRWRSCQRQGLTGPLLENLLEEISEQLPESTWPEVSVRPAPPPAQEQFPSSLGAPGQAPLVPTIPWCSLQQREPAAVKVYVDGSWSARRRCGGVACVYAQNSHIGMLASYLPPPVPDNHCAEAAAILLALSAPELQSYPLEIHTDSNTVICALHDPEHARLPPATLEKIYEILRLCQERAVAIRYLRSRTGNLMHDKADQLAGWISLLGGDLEK
jgi:ribonuclease HI